MDCLNSVAIFSTDCGHYGEVILRVKDTFYLLLWLRGCCCRKVSIRVNVWNVDREKKIIAILERWPFVEV